MYHLSCSQAEDGLVLRRGECNDFGNHVAPGAEAHISFQLYGDPRAPMSYFHIDTDDS